MTKSRARIASFASLAMLGVTVTIFSARSNAAALTYILQGAASGSIRQNKSITAFTDIPFTAVYTSNANTQGFSDLNFSAIYPLTVELIVGSQKGTFQGALGSDGLNEIYTAPADGLGFQVYFQSSQPLITLSESKFEYLISDPISPVSLTQIFPNDRVPEPFVTSLGVIDWSSFSSVTFAATGATATPEPSTILTLGMGTLALYTFQLRARSRRSRLRNVL